MTTLMVCWWIWGGACFHAWQLADYPTPKECEQARLELIAGKKVPDAAFCKPADKEKP